MCPTTRPTTELFRPPKPWPYGVTRRAPEAPTDVSNWVPCTYCDGAGTVNVLEPGLGYLFDSYDEPVTCPKCVGAGEVRREELEA